MLRSTIDEKTKQNNPEKATVVNLGVSVLHLKVTEKTENPIDESIPKIKPITELEPELPNAIIIIPTVAIKIEIQTFKDIFSLRNKKSKNRSASSFVCGYFVVFWTSRSEIYG